MSKSKRFRVPATQPLPPERTASRNLPLIFLSVVSIAIVVIYVRNWPVTNASPQAVNLSGTGVPPDVAGAINRGRGQAAPAPMSITPDTADRFAGVPREPGEGYEQHRATIAVARTGRSQPRPPQYTGLSKD
jgi:hypothetical protein